MPVEIEAFTIAGLTRDTRSNLQIIVVDEQFTLALACQYPVNPCRQGHYKSPNKPYPNGVIFWQSMALTGFRRGRKRILPTKGRGNRQGIKLFHGREIC
jgi:hypothetical protein